MDCMQEACIKIQRPINDLIDFYSSVKSICLETSLKVYDDEQKVAAIKNARLETVSELMKLIQENYRVYTAIEEYKYSGDFMWESGLLEVLSCEIKSKYIEFDYYSFKYDSVKKQPDFYDDQLPYFSFIINEITLLQFNSTIDDLEWEYIKKNVTHVDGTSEKSKEITNTETLDNSTKKPSFNSKLNDKQIEILTECINDGRLFDRTITSQDLIKFFSCTLENKFKSIHNKLIAYLFNSLSEYEYIISTWQNVIDTNELIICPNSDNILLARDLHQANSRAKSIKPSRFEIIDKYIEQLNIHKTTA
jgi:hypothetical protein